MIFKKLYFGIFVLLIAGCRQGDKSIAQLEQKETLEDYDGNIYDWVKIGDQIWMAENLKVTHYANGDLIPDGVGVDLEVVDKNSKYRFVYNDSIFYKEEYGLLYTWAAALNGENYENPDDQIQGACPNGWHIPSDKDWFVLESLLGVPDDELDILGSRGTDEGGKLKQSGFSIWKSPNVGSTNETLFNAKPSGYYLNGNFDRKGLGTYFWGPNGSDDDFAINHSVRYNESSIGRGRGYKDSGFSVRCIKN